MAFALKDKRSLGIVSGLRADMFDIVTIVVAELVDANAVRFFVNAVQELSLHEAELRGVEQAFKHRVLHALTVVRANLRHMP